MLAAAAAVFYYKQSQQPPQTATPPPPEPAAPAPETAQPEVQYPVPTIEAPEEAPPLPALHESDEAVRDAMEKSFGKAPVEAFLVPTEIIRHLVATIDSLDRGPVPLHFRPMKHVPGLPTVNAKDGKIILSPDNTKRYEPYISALRAIDAKQFADLYLRYYPLFQNAYEDLGYPGRYFNDRLIQIIDHLLETPDISEPIELIWPKVLYQFADPELEKRSWGQKTLIRIGPANAAAVKAKLREIRASIAIKADKS
ncbi:MAG: DUF3014 domain-containing protein [Pseudomonadota bacterium]|nr:DUF3014 domain-containing protein [Pseudomonadota bacterium]